MRRILAGLLFMLGMAVGVSAQTTSTFTVDSGTQCAPYLAPVEPECYYPIIGMNSEGQIRWLVYNTNTGTVSIIEPTYPNQTVDFFGTGLEVMVTPILSYTTGTPNTLGATKVSYQEMKGTFNGGTLDLIFETYGVYRRIGRYYSGYAYEVMVVNSVVDQNGKTVTGYGPSVVEY